jgi:methionyl-tRNA synthetase
VRTHNGPLADTLGNLVHRSTNLCGKYCEGKVPGVQASACYLELVEKDKPMDLKALALQV